MSPPRPPAGLPGRWVLIVDVSVDPEIEDQWNTWYDDVHLPDICSCPGFVEAARYVTADATGERRYQTLYRLEGPEALDSTEFARRRGWGPFEGRVDARVRLYERRSPA
jgi:hypothetical protein